MKEAGKGTQLFAGTFPIFIFCSQARKNIIKAWVLVTSLLFGDDLQTELTRIRTTNKIGNTTNPSSHASSQRRLYKPSTSNYGNKKPPFLWRGPQSYRRLENNSKRGQNRGQN
jgi:hypothetical protein